MSCCKLIQQHFQFFQFKNLSSASGVNVICVPGGLYPSLDSHNIPADFGKSLIFVTKADESTFVMILPKSG